MKFKHYLESITGIGIFPMVSLVIFFGFFLILTLWAVRVRKDYIADMKQIPFSEYETAENQQNIH